jgi:hypothetical protein
MLIASFINRLLKFSIEKVVFKTLNIFYVIIYIL